MGDRQCLAMFCLLRIVSCNENKGRKLLFRVDGGERFHSLSSVSWELGVDRSKYCTYL